MHKQTLNDRLQEEKFSETPTYNVADLAHTLITKMSDREPPISNCGTWQVVVEIVRIKLSKSVYVSRTDQRSILGYIEANYGRAKKYRTKDNKLYGGPFIDLVKSLSLTIYLCL